MTFRNAFLRGFGAALAGTALLSAPAFAGSEPGAQQLQPSGEAPLQMSQSSQKDAQIAQTYIPLVGEVGSASVEGTGFYVTVGAGAAWAGNWDFHDKLDDYNFNGNSNFIGGF